MSSEQQTQSTADFKVGDLVCVVQGAFAWLAPYRIVWSVEKLETINGAVIANIISFCICQVGEFQRVMPLKLSHRVWGTYDVIDLRKCNAFGIFECEADEVEEFVPLSRSEARNEAEPFAKNVNGLPCISFDDCKTLLGEYRFKLLQDDPLRNKPGNGFIYHWNVIDYLCCEDPMGERRKK